jgi:hypothetical protein
MKRPLARRREPFLSGTKALSSTLHRRSVLWTGLDYNLPTFCMADFASSWPIGSSQMGSVTAVAALGSPGAPFPRAVRCSASCAGSSRIVRFNWEVS